MFIKKEPVLFLFKKTWYFSLGNRRNVVFFLILFVCSNLTSLLFPLIFARFLNEIQRSGITSNNISHLLLILVSFLGVTTLFWFFHGFGRVIERKNSFFVRYKYQEYLLKGVLDLGLSWHGARDSGDTIDKIKKATDGLYRFSDSIFLVMDIVIKIIGTTTVLYFFSPYISLFAVLFIALSLVLLFQFDKRLVKQYRSLNLFDNRIAAKIFDALSNVTSVIILNVREPILRNIGRVTEQPEKLYKQNVVLNEFKWFTGALCFDLLVVTPLIFYTLYLFRNNLPVEIGTLSALFLYLSRMSEVFFTFSGFYENVIVYKASVENAQSIEESFEKHKRAKKEAIEWDEIALQKINFSYEEKGHRQKHINNISLEFRRGERIALIGESGSGKTTLLKVLHGLYPNARAQICFNHGAKQSTNFADIDLRTMLVPQEPELFSASILENVTFGVEYPLGDVREAIQLAQFKDVLEQLPRGLKSVVNEKGVNLSGGQKQRLALARALLFAQNKDVILLDESTSSVDPLNEAKIYENIFARFKDKTILASIHKLNLLRYFDRIVIFESGEKVDEGTFEELLGRNTSFKEAWNQFVNVEG